MKDLSEDLPPSTFEVDATLRPRLDAIPGLKGDGERTLASLSDLAGTQADFVEDELVVIADNIEVVEELAHRWHGALSATVNMTDKSDGELPNYYLVTIDSSDADLETLVDDARQLDPSSRNDIVLSSDRGLRTLTAAIHEAVAGRALVGLNWILLPAAEAPTGQNLPGGTAYTSDPASWPYMSADGPQAIGVIGAWERLREARRLGTPVSLAILDAGFSINQDMLASVRLIPADANNVPNPWPTSTGRAAPWHGTNVASAAAGIANNAFGAAGPAGALSALSLVLVQSPSPDIFQIAQYIMQTLPATLAAGPRIVNISAEVSLPAVVGLLGQPVALLAWTLRRAGMLVFAAAGNQGQDIDALDCLSICWERAWWLPVEASGVVGVGGLAGNSISRSRQSNFGSAREGDTVDIFGPWDVWVGPDPGSPANACRPVSGTSFSSPFVAGVAALIWAAQPNLNPDQVENILMRSASTGSPDASVPRWVNANRAVLTALGWNEETDWRWCRKCQGLWKGGVLASCPAGGRHERRGSGNYAVINDSDSHPGQSGWRRCLLCGGLWFGEREGRCAATGNGHWRVLSANYKVGTEVGQSGWRWCRNCEGLWFGASNGGRCPAGGRHVDDGSGRYTVVIAGSSTAR